VSSPVGYEPVEEEVCRVVCRPKVDKSNAGLGLEIFKELNCVANKNGNFLNLSRKYDELKM
jgi:hypothetical protein